MSHAVSSNKQFIDSESKIYILLLQCQGDMLNRTHPQNVSASFNQKLIYAGGRSGICVLTTKARRILSVGFTDGCRMYWLVLERHRERYTMTK